jgi:hypothetical protein
MALMNICRISARLEAGLLAAKLTKIRMDGANENQPGAVE